MFDSARYSNFPITTHDALFHAATENKLDFSLTIPKTDNYVLIIDNRDNAKERHFSIDFKASIDLPMAKPQSSPENVTVEKINQQLTKFSDSLRKAFIFEPIDIQLAKCGVANAFNKASTIYLCAEYVALLQTKLQEKDKIQKALIFTLMHEMGHILLNQWNYPFSKNEELIDEFATVVLTMVGHQSAAVTQAAFFASIPAKLEISQNIDKDIRHPFSAQRARNIHRTIESHETIKKWQALLIPHMQTAYLRYLLTRNDDWIDQDSLKQELSERNP